MPILDGETWNGMPCHPKVYQLSAPMPLLLGRLLNLHEVPFQSIKLELATSRASPIVWRSCLGDSILGGIHGITINNTTRSGPSSLTSNPSTITSRAKRVTTTFTPSESWMREAPLPWCTPKSQAKEGSMSLAVVWRRVNLGPITLDALWSTSSQGSQTRPKVSRVGPAYWDHLRPSFG